ncbi:hypothetical protein [Vibrio cholerae]|uniref:hypothetical protein n=1 Tax=Vibrio cholerae TaxID=666 RepID=UPI0029C3ED7E|nr:hypothetical protein [Vibrio cholerae]MDX5049141.1 hypothetical protein [Vibrio cholerae]
MAVVKKPISGVKVNTLFKDISLNEYNLDPSAYAYELATLSSKWKADGYVEIYEKPSSPKYGQVKSSEYNDKGHFIYQYCDVFHGRVIDGQYDPLIVVKFTEDPDDSNQEYLSLRFLANHAQLFGRKSDKDNRSVLDLLRNTADAHLQDGDDKDPK